MIVALQPAHVEAAAAIEARDGDVGWSRADFEKETTASPARFFVMTTPTAPEGSPLTVRGDDDFVVAYGGYWKAGPEAQITNLVVARDHRCQGHARALLSFVLDRARQEGCTTCTLEVRASNAHTQRLYAKMGFRETGRRPKLYKNPEEDAVLMEKFL